ncbi:MAG: RnfABCDGE type electron transport complex subunit D [Clostridia bacterium]|nr:RnfABCDGE type electron transport complex subunit D [Clostridia bacterium]
MNKLIVSTSPHITSKDSTQRIMLDVIIALMPLVIAAVVLYGFYPLFTVILCSGSAVFAEWLFNLIMKRKQTVSDLSAIVTGIILGLNMPSVVPFYIPMVGAFFAIIVVKMLFGGIGRNFANPAIAARIFCMLCWTTAMTQFVPAQFASAGVVADGGWNFFANFQYSLAEFPAGISTATPLAGIGKALENGTNPAAGLNALNMFLGIMGGSAGEVCTLAVLIGAVYLLIRQVIDWKIPVCYLGSFVVFTAIFYANTGYVGEYIWTGLLSGGLMFGAFFMATDYATSPKAPIGVIIYGIGLGFMTVVIRKFSAFPEGVSFAILIMNIVTPFLDKIRPRTFGKPRRNYVEIFKEKIAEKKAKKEAQAQAAEGGNN